MTCEGKYVHTIVCDCEPQKLIKLKEYKLSNTFTYGGIPVPPHPMQLKCDRSANVLRSEKNIINANGCNGLGRENRPREYE